MSRGYKQGLRKSLRYVKLYGVARTCSKVFAEFHFSNRLPTGLKAWRFPQFGAVGASSVAMIGCGKFAFSTLAYFLYKENRNFLRCTLDINPERSRSLANFYHADYVADELDQILLDPQVRLVVISSNHASHTEYAARCLEAGKAVHIEKPHIVSWEQLNTLMVAMRSNPDQPVFLGFNRPRSPLFGLLMNLVGDQSGPTSLNWFIAGHEIPEDHWYFSKEEGGRVLGNLIHWSDLSYRLIGPNLAWPCRIVPASPVGSKSDFLVGLEFGDGSSAAISFSAKGHAFEGVKEALNLQKGNLIANLMDFQQLNVDIGPLKKKVKLRHRQYGHQENILNSFQRATRRESGEELTTVWASGALILAIREALDTGQPQFLSGFF